MTGTDVALYRLDRTYAQLKAAGAKVFRLTTTPVRAGDPLTIAYSGFRLGCTAEAVVAHLREGGTTVVGIHNTHNDSGERCTDDNPCEVAADGTVTSVAGRGYGQQVDGIAACLAEGSELALSRPGCTLTGSRS